jgi:uncharacterized membrane protein YfhO
LSGLEAGQGEYRMRTSAAGARQLVLSVTFHPEWKCTVDGKETPIHRTDYAFMSVRVPAGQHEVVWRFVPRRFYQGLVGTVIGAVLTIGFLAVVPLLRRHRGLLKKESP